MTTNHKKEKAPITKEKLAYEVAKCIKAYLVKLEVRGQGNLGAPCTNLTFRRARPPSIFPSEICT